MLCCFQSPSPLAGEGRGEGVYFSPLAGEGRGEGVYFVVGSKLFIALGIQNV